MLITRVEILEPKNLPKNCYFWLAPKVFEESLDFKLKDEEKIYGLKFQYFNMDEEKLRIRFDTIISHTACLRGFDSKKVVFKVFDEKVERIETRLVKPWKSYSKETSYLEFE